MPRGCAHCGEKETPTHPTRYSVALPCGHLWHCACFFAANRDLRLSSAEKRDALVLTKGERWFCLVCWTSFKIDQLARETLLRRAGAWR